MISPQAPPTSSTKAARDLPPELWLRILSFLPRGSVHKMIGVSREVSYLALSDKYSKIQLDSDEKTLKTFEQLNGPIVANLVKVLRIEPTFLSAGSATTPSLVTEDRTPRPNASRLSKFLSRCLLWPSKLFNGSFGRNRRLSDRFFSSKRTDLVPQNRPNPLQFLDQRILNSASSALPKCFNLRDITITISDTCPLTSAFHSFLRALWEARGNNIEKMAISTTFTKIAEILESIPKPSCQLSSLKSLDITIEKSRASLDSNGTSFATDAIAKTVHDVSANLTCLKILPEATEDDLAVLFWRLGTLPNLRVFDVVIGTQTLASDGGEGFTAFLNANKSPLEHLVLKPFLEPSETPPGFDISTLREWLANEFTRIKFPKLRTLEMDFSREVGDPMETLSYFPKLEPVMPSLTSLTLSHAALSLDDLDFALEMATGTELKGLRCTVKLFSPQMLECLVTKTPHLTSLDLTYEKKAARDPSQATTRGMEPSQPRFRFYPEWPLSRLRIACRGTNCGGTHPDRKLARQVGNTVSQNVVLDFTYRGCFCGEGEQVDAPSSHTGGLARH